jgi:threonine synthase
MNRLKGRFAALIPITFALAQISFAQPTNTEQVQAISARLWQSGYLPGEHSAVSFRAVWRLSAAIIP